MIALPQMARRVAIVLAVLGALAGPLWTGSASAQTGMNQPRMFEALQALRAARSSLESAAPNKGGYRLRALARINEAIRDVKAGIDYAY